MPEYARTLDELARAVGRSPGQLAYYKSRGFDCKKTRKGYNVDRLRKWLRANIAESPNPAGGGRRHRAASSGNLRDDLLRAQIAEREATAELKGIKVRLEQGDLIPRERVEEEERAKSAVVRRTVMGFARSLPPLLVGQDAREMETTIAKKARELLEKLARM